MAQSKYKKMQVNPLQNKWEETGAALLTEDDAATLNEVTIHTGIKYVKDAKPKAIKK